MVGELFKMRTGINIVTVPYRGAANVMTDMLAGQIDMSFEPTSITLGHVRDGKVRPLAVTGATRSSELPDVPTMIESGVPDMVAVSWTGLVAPPTHTAGDHRAAEPGGERRAQIRGHDRGAAQARLEPARRIAAGFPQPADRGSRRNGSRW